MSMTYDPQLDEGEIVPFLGETFPHIDRYVLASFSLERYHPVMPDDEKLTPADPDDLASSLAFALRFEGRKRWHDADELMAAIVAQRLIRYLERARYVVMKRPPIGGSRRR